MEMADQILDRRIPLNTKGMKLRDVLLSVNVIKQGDTVERLRTLKGGTEKAEAIFLGVVAGPDGDRLKKLFCVKVFERKERKLFLELRARIREDRKHFEGKRLARLLPLDTHDDDKGDDDTGAGVFIYNDGALILNILRSPHFRSVDRPYDITSGIAGFSRVYRIKAHRFTPYSPASDFYIKFNRPKKQEDEWKVIKHCRSQGFDHNLSCLILPKGWNKMMHGCVIYPTFGDEEHNGHSTSLRDFLLGTSSRNQFEPVAALLGNALHVLFHRQQDLDDVPKHYKDPFNELLEADIKLRVARAWQKDPALSQLLDTEKNVKLVRGTYGVSDPQRKVDQLLLEETSVGIKNSKWRHRGKIELGRVHGDLQSTNILVWWSDVEPPAPKEVKFIDLEKFKPAGRYPIVDDLASLEADFFFSIYPVWVKKYTKDAQLERKEQLRVGLDVLLYVLDCLSEYERPKFEHPPDADENLVNMTGDWCWRLRDMACKLLAGDKSFNLKRYHSSLLLHCLQHLSRRSVASEPLRPGILLLVASVVAEIIQRSGG